MTRLDVDFRFVEFTYELWMIDEQIKLIDSTLSALQQQGLTSFESGLDLEDPADRDVAFHFRRRLDDGIASRVFVYAPAIALWATFEAVTTALAEYVRSERKIELRLGDLRGPLVRRLRSYERDVLKVELIPESTDWSALTDLYQVRNVLAHANGRIADVKGLKSRRRIDSAIKREAGLDIVDGYLVLRSTYLRRSFELVSACVHAGIQNLRRTFPLGAHLGPSE